MDFTERLRSAESLDDFRALKDDIPKYTNSFFRDIFSPVVLRACLLYVKPSYSRTLKIFYIVAEHYRVDLLQVFFNGFLTLEGLITSEEHGFYILVGRVLSDGYVDLLKFFLEKGLNINHFNCLGRPYLSSAVVGGNVDIMDLLLAKGADVNAPDRFGNTPVFHAMWSSDVRILDRLIVHGANLFLRNGEGESLWKAVPFYWYQERMLPNYQRIADMGVPLDKEVYDDVHRQGALNPILKGLLKIMHEVMKKQGFEVDDLVDTAE